MGIRRTKHAVYDLKYHLVWIPIITPPDVPHKASGDMTFISLTALHNVYGQCIGRKIPHEATEEVYRDNLEDVTKVGQYVEYEGPGGQCTTE